MPIETPWGLEDGDAMCSKLSYLPLYLAGLDGEHFAVLDEEDYLWASRWKWHAHKNKNGKIYARRNGCYMGRSVSVYLHKAVCLRAHGMPPSASHIIADHKRGNSLDDRRFNLRWATPSENRQNYNGLYALQTRLDFKAGKGPNRLLRAHIFGGNRGLGRSANSADADLRKLRLSGVEGCAADHAEADT